ncbi:lipopolysaccharide biosynthesis protein [Paracraurococcus lichenis]|uniref:Oligosaccharide flippase family protein n=1 Tax=Paracraurococcus lichenis TaxID=3064888 RepID=A0ABT9E2J9_9PROT|nr:oligosaccharide flippase family protein [Paracraurococcus sp. LOR1-02]MDO9710387.1 oligosaccharide flippase family protein [Paracraurococcus sp. LOR1-02]
MLPAARRALRVNLPLLLNSGAVTIGNVCTAVLGFAFWWVAARSFPPETVGIASALISMMGLIGLLGEVGLGTLLIGEPPRQDRADRGLIPAALLTSLVVSGALGLAYALLTAAWPVLGRAGDGGSMQIPLFAVGCALTGVALVGDHALIGLLRSDIQLLRNVSFSLVKLLLLAGMALLWPGQGGMAILLVWTLGAALSLLLAGSIAVRRGVFVPGPPDMLLLPPRIARVADHHALNLAAQAPAILFPFLVAVLFSPTVNAAFFPAWAVVHAASMFPAALTVVLYRIGNQDADGGAGRLGFSLILATGFSLLAGLVLFLASRDILAFFNPAYPDIAGASLRLLGFGIVSLSVRAHYLALMRLRGTMRRASVRYAAWSSFEIAAACLGGSLAGLEGFTLGWLLSISAQALAMLPPLLATARFPLGMKGAAMGYTAGLRAAPEVSNRPGAAKEARP